MSRMAGVDSCSRRYAPGLSQWAAMVVTMRPERCTSVMEASCGRAALRACWRSSSAWASRRSSGRLHSRRSGRRTTAIVHLCFAELLQQQWRVDENAICQECLQGVPNRSGVCLCLADVVGCVKWGREVRLKDAEAPGRSRGIQTLSLSTASVPR